ncbi:MAG: hypothetical protein HGGPFJEG_02522 [Ignavibacteria bacterium]|nr:hypothetical protein [Ignavibacteria bacterium]
MEKNFDLQPHLENSIVIISPLKKQDFEKLFEAASDPLLWEQHPNKDRYKREVFENFFKGALESGGAFIVYNAVTNEVIGSSRYYGYLPEEKSVSIGYTFIKRSCWGGKYNRALKKLMLDHAFNHVEKVYFHIGANNIRSQKAILKLKAEKTGEADIEYYGEAPYRNFIYTMTKDKWKSISSDVM